MTLTTNHVAGDPNHPSEHNAIAIQVNANTTQATQNAADISTNSTAIATAKARTATGTPPGSGLLAWTFDPAAISSQSSLTAGMVYVAQIEAPAAMTVSTVFANITSGGSGLTHGYAGVYYGGALLAQSTDQVTAWAGTGVMPMALTGSAVIPGAAVFYVALMFTGTTSPQFSRGGLTQATNIAVNRFGNANTGLSALPATLSTISASNAPIWVAVS